MNIIHTNPSSFKHNVQTICTQHAPEHTAEAGQDGEDKFGISLRMHLEDWKALHTAVQAIVLDPLKKNIIDLDHDPLLASVLEPAALAEPRPKTPHLSPALCPKTISPPGAKGVSPRMSAAVRCH